MSTVLFRGGSVLNTSEGKLLEGYELLVEGDRIKELSDIPIRSNCAEVIELGGRVLMPGLIDAHVHLYASELNTMAMANVPMTFVVARASQVMKRMLRRGFTTVRDNGGADWGLKQAVDSGVLAGPRLFIAGRVLSQTGGHGDYRSRTGGDERHVCSCANGLDAFARIVDGVPAVLQAARDELRKGADHIKIMISGGVASPHDPLESLQFTDEEIKASVQAAECWGKYVAAHAYTAPAIRRGVQCGIRSIEHANLIDKETAAEVARHGAFVVPTLVTYHSINRFGKELGLSEATLEKNRRVLEAGFQSLELCRKAGINLGFGTDLLGTLEAEQSNEFIIRSEVQSAAEILRSATFVNACLLGKPGELGSVEEGAFADLIVVNGNPLRDLALLNGQGENISMIMKGGQFYKNEGAATGARVGVA
jgi:imidazolonepropionase-like amidohydrolase